MYSPWAQTLFTIKNGQNEKISQLEGFIDGKSWNPSHVHDDNHIINLKRNNTTLGYFKEYGWNNYFKGGISEIMIFDKELTEEELVELNYYLSFHGE